LIGIVSNLRIPLLLSLLAWPFAAAAEVSDRAYDRAVDLIDRLYLYPEKVGAPVLLQSAAEGVSERMDWLIVEPDGDAVHLRHGDGSAIGSVSVASMETLPEALRALESVVRDAGQPIDEDLDLRLAIIKGMTQSLDRYSRILAGERLDRFDVRLKGTLVGVGATLTLQNDELWVKALIADGPAAKGGLQIGDIIVRIDGTSTVNMPLSEATRRIRGDLDTIVTMEVKRGEATLDVPLTRAKVIVPNVRHEVLSGNIGYIEIDHFSQKTVVNLVASMRSLKEQGALSKGLVIDLRGNTGGSMKEAARSADQFLQDGMLLRTVGPDGGRVQNLQARMDAIDAGNEPRVAVAILVDERTASGSEILAGALFELDRAVLVGTRSYGKGTVQKIYNLDEESRLKLTVAQYLLANDRSIADAGLVPDVVLRPVELDSFGARFRGWTTEETGVGWEQIVPIVDEGAGWRGEEHATGEDAVLDVARRAVLRSVGPERDSVLLAMNEVITEVRASQEAALFDALKAKEIDWSVPEAFSETTPDASVSLSTSTDPSRPDAITLTADIENHGTEPLYRAVVQLDSDSFSLWEGLVVPVGLVPAGESAQGQITVQLRPGVKNREDDVTMAIRSAGQPAIEAGADVLGAFSSERPRVSVTAKLTGEGADRIASIAVQNLTAISIAGLEVGFGFPGDVDVELLDHARRVPLLMGRDNETIELAVRVGPEAPDVLPLHLNVRGERFGRVASLPLELPLSGAMVSIEAPVVTIGEHALSAAVGEYHVPITATDETRIKHVVVYVNGKKISWEAGTDGPLSIDAAVTLEAGPNRIVAIAEDEQGVRTRRSFTVRGETPASVDAE